MNSFLASMVTAGREWLNSVRGGEILQPWDLSDLIRELMSAKGEASGIALGRDIVESYSNVSREQQDNFFNTLLCEFDVTPSSIADAANEYSIERSDINFRRLMNVCEPKRQELFRRINRAPGGTAMLLDMRQKLLSRQKDSPQLGRIEADIGHLFASWFNRGFLQIERIDWNSPAVLLEKLMQYESVHKMNGWEDLRRRLAPDRRCYAFFHSALLGEPLIFIEVALMQGLSERISTILEPGTDLLDVELADTAVFYSINNCQKGLLGIPLGNFLIKQVVLEIQQDVPNISTFATLSPVPGFCAWLNQEADKREGTSIAVIATKFFKSLEKLDDDCDDSLIELDPTLLELCAHFLVNERTGNEPSDPVARFHLRNGARLDRINWNSDMSSRSLKQSAGILVNYIYEVSEIENNHEKFVLHGEVATSSSVLALANEINLSVNISAPRSAA